MGLPVYVVNCSQIFCTFAVETTNTLREPRLDSCELLSNFLYFCSRNNISVIAITPPTLWIALKFFVLLQSKQRSCISVGCTSRCELLSNFLYFCSRNNRSWRRMVKTLVVNCSQIFCTFAVETTNGGVRDYLRELWIALKFFVLLQSKQHPATTPSMFLVVNCSQIFCTFAVETTNWASALGMLCCELLSNFLYFCSRNNPPAPSPMNENVVNCSQIFCTFAVETTWCSSLYSCMSLWIALKFFVLLQSKQLFYHQNESY